MKWVCHFKLGAHNLPKQGGFSLSNEEQNRDDRFDSGITTSGDLKLSGSPIVTTMADPGSSKLTTRELSGRWQAGTLCERVRR